jgi:alpha-beta hydrolase superfamily lysophospholipase
MARTILPLLPLLLLLVAGARPAAGQAVPAEVYVPASGEGPHPVAVLGHAYMTDAVRYAWLAEALVDAGWIVTVPTTRMSWLVDPDAFAADLAGARDDLAAAGQDPGSALFGRVGDRAVVLGHSLGGSAGVRAAAAGGFAALVTMAVLDDGERPTRRMAEDVTVPVLMLAAAGDCVTPAADHELPVWEALASANKLGVMLAEGTHCGFAAPDDECLAAEQACGTAPRDGQAQQARVLSLLMPWLAVVLDGDETARETLQADLTAATDLQWRGGEQVPARAAGWGGLRGLYR